MMDISLGLIGLGYWHYGISAMMHTFTALTLAIDSYRIRPNLLT